MKSYEIRYFPAGAVTPGGFVEHVVTLDAAERRLADIKRGERPVRTYTRDVTYDFETWAIYPVEIPPEWGEVSP